MKIVPKYIIRFDGANYRAMVSSKCDHYDTMGLAKYKGQALTTGGSNLSSECNLRTEIFNFEENQWNDGPDYPFAS